MTMKTVLYFCFACVVLSLEEASGAAARPPLTEKTCAFKPPRVNLRMTEKFPELHQLHEAFSEKVRQLEGSEEWTLFHPTPYAFIKFFRWFRKQGRPLTKEYINETIAFHVLPKTVFSKDIKEGSNIVPTLLLNPRYVNLNGTGQVVNVYRKPAHSVHHDHFPIKVSHGIPGWPKTEASVVKVDLKCKGGVVHVIDKVMWFPRFSSSTLQDGGADAMNSCLNSVGLSALVDTASNITVFAPMNDALEAILGKGDVSPKDLKDVLLCHVAKGTHYSPELMTDTKVLTMWNGKKVQITLEDHTFNIGGAKVVIKNVLLRNGVMHVLDKTMTPKPTDGSGSA